MKEAGFLEKLITGALEDLKAVDVRTFDVQRLTTITDTMIIASGTSDRHVRALADKVVEAARANGCKPMGTEGEGDGEWVLVDLGDVVVHVMQPRIRDFYNLEKLWDPGELARRRDALSSD